MPVNTDTTDITNIDKVPLSHVESWSAYWRTLYAQKRRLHDVSPKQIMLGQLFTLVITMGVGVYISQNQSALLLVGTTFLLYPVLAELLSSSAAVLTASLHHEIDTIEGSKIKAVCLAVLKSLIVALAASACIGSLAGIIGVFLFEAGFLRTLTLAVAVGGITGLVGFPFMTGVMFLARRLRANPDDVAPPIETTIFHTFTLVAIVLVSRVMS